MGTELLPVTRAVLARDPRVVAEVRRLGERHGADYTDDEAVRERLDAHRRAVDRAQYVWSVWVGVLLLVAGIVLGTFAGAIPRLREYETGIAILPGAALCVISLPLIVHAARHGKRKLTHPYLVGYRQVLAVALAHGLPVSHVPDWLTGSQSGEGARYGRVPIPQLPPVEPWQGPAAEDPAGPAHTGAPAPLPVPERPALVDVYERMEEDGEWYTEAIAFLVLMGGVGAAVVYTAAGPVGLLFLAAFPLAAYLGYRSSLRSRRLARARTAALAHARELVAAQRSGTAVPPLSKHLAELVQNPPPDTTDV